MSGLNQPMGRCQGETRPRAGVLGFGGEGCAARMLQTFLRLPASLLLPAVY